MDAATLESTIEAAWDNADTISTTTQGAVRDAIETALNGMDSGELRVAEKRTEGWHVNQWLKKAVLLSFRIYDMAPVPGGPGENAPGSTKSPPSSRAGATTGSATRASARCRTAWFAARPISRRARC